MPEITANDGTTLYYEEQGEGRPIVLIHGWTFTGRFFHRNVGTIARHARVITVDLRGHGKSGKPHHGYRISRLAADLRDLLTALNLHDVTLLGWSLGCPIIWSYLELFGQERVRNAIFVQQTPRQYFTPEWKFGHATCYDEAGLTFLQQQLIFRAEAFDKENLEGCLNNPIPEDEAQFLLAEMAQSPAYARSALMADHTVHDWRDIIPHLMIPALVLVAQKDKVLNAEGPKWVAEHLPNGTEVLFENSAHMLFIDETEKFNDTVISFLEH